MKRLRTNDTKHNKKQKLSTKCKILDTIENIKRPRGIIKTPCGKFLIGTEGHSIYRCNLETKQKFRIAGSVNKSGHQNGPRDEARFHCPTSLTLSKDLKTLFFSDVINSVIRAICVGTGVTITFAGQVGIYDIVDGPKEKACFKFPRKLKLSPDGNTLYVVDDYKLRTICIATGQVDTIHTFKNEILNLTVSPDGKHVYICHWVQVLKFNLETNKSEIISKGETGYFGCKLSKDGQLLFISNRRSKEIIIVNFVTNQVIDTITLYFKPAMLTISTNGKQLFVCCYFTRNIQVLDISEYCTNFKTFLQLQLSKHSFLPRPVIKRFSI
jgi:DNA-binding beta-propeller fold protein YncE